MSRCVILWSRTGPLATCCDLSKILTLDFDLDWSELQKPTFTMTSDVRRKKEEPASLLTGSLNTIHLPLDSQFNRSRRHRKLYLFGVSFRCIFSLYLFGGDKPRMRNAEAILSR